MVRSVCSESFNKPRLSSVTCTVHTSQVHMGTHETLKDHHSKSGEDPGFHKLTGTKFVKQGLRKEIPYDKKI